MKEMKDQVNNAMDMLVEVVATVNQRQDVYDEVAKSYKLLVMALTKQGFTPEAALAIVTAQGLTALKTSQ